MIISMKRLTLVALKDDEQAILKALQRLSAVEVIETEQESCPESALPQLEERVNRLEDAMSALKPYAPKKGLFAPETEVCEKDLFDSLHLGITKSERIEELQREIGSIQAQIEKHNDLMAQLLPWFGCEVDIDSLVGSKRVRCFAGLLPEVELSRLDELSDILDYERYPGSNPVPVIICCDVRDVKQVSSALKTLQWMDVTFPKLHGTPKQAYEGLAGETEALTKRREALSNQLKEMGSDTEEITRAYEAAVIERDRAKVAEDFTRTAATFCMEGWIRSDEIDCVDQAIAAVTDAYYMDVRDPEEGEVAPSVVKNTEFVEPFEAVTNLYSRPDPNGMDGTPYMTPFYILLFGLMLSDTGYGIVLAIGCYLFKKLKQPRGMMGSLANVLFWGGLSTIIWGVLVGSFFGLDFDVLFGTKDLFPLLVDPMGDPIGMLILCFGLGILHIFFGIILKMKLSFSRGDWQTAIFDNLSWILTITGLIMLALPATKVIGIALAGIGALTILLFKGREKKNPVARTIAGLGELYQVTGYLSDVLSYARLFALGIATGVIASVFNDLCAMLMGSPNIVLKILGIIVACALLVALHLFNVGINTLGAFVHCARLQYVEFYGKFYESGGRAFKPLGMAPKHVRLSNHQS